MIRAVTLWLSLLVLPAFGAPSLAGTWFGTGEPYDKSEMYLDHFLPNGELHSQFRACHNGKATDSTEDGAWSVVGNILTIHMERHNGVAAPRVDVYRLDLITAQRFKDVYLPLNFPFDERRVADDFQMPSCDLVS